MSFIVSTCGKCEKQPEETNIYYRLRSSWMDKLYYFTNNDDLIIDSISKIYCNMIIYGIVYEESLTQRVESLVDIINKKIILFEQFTDETQPLMKDHVNDSDIDNYYNELFSSLRMDKIEDIKNVLSSTKQSMEDKYNPK